VWLLQRSSKSSSQGARYCVLITRLIYLNVEVLSIEILSDLRWLSSRGLFDCVSFKSLFCWEWDFVNKHTIWAIEWSSIEVWFLNSALTTMKDIQVDWKVEMLRKRENQDLTMCRLRVRNCAGLNSIVSLSHTSLYLETSMHFYDLEFPSNKKIDGFSFSWDYSTKASYSEVLKEGVRIGGISCIENLSWEWYSSVAIV